MTVPSGRVIAETLFADAAGRMQAGDTAGAERLFRETLAHAPELAEAWVNLGLLLDEGRDDTEAEACYRRALALRADFPETHVNLGGLLARHKRFDEAEAAYAQALRLAPDRPGTWSNLGVLYASQRLDEEAEACYDQALALDENLPRARFNLGVLRLRQGRWEAGWRGLEARDWYAALKRQLQCPLWRGEPLAGRPLLIGYEVGHGDMVQFSRYAVLLKARGAGAITLLCHPALKRLFATLAGVDTLLGFDESWPSPQPWALWTPLMSLPYQCATRLDNIPASLPYLHAEPALVAHWAEVLPAGRLRVGLVWKGNPKFENDADRSLPSLATLLPLAVVPGVVFASLQKGAGEDEAAQPPAGLQVTALGARMRDFADAAAIIAGLDLVIAVDTAMAHLAGALGKPCWLMLPRYQTDWRWLEERSDSPWYPGVMRLFRQRTAGDWTPVVDAMVTALRALPALTV